MKQTVIKKPLPNLQTYGVPENILSESSPGFVTSAKDEFQKICKLLKKMCSNVELINCPSDAKAIFHAIDERAYQIMKECKLSWRASTLHPKIYFIDNVNEWDIEDVKKCIRLGRSAGIFYVYYVEDISTEIGTILTNTYNPPKPF